MSARMDAPVECACEEMAAHHTLEMMVRRLMAMQGISEESQIQSSFQVVFMNALANIDSIRAINQAKEPA
jgi:hypothetical protein